MLGATEVQYLPAVVADQNKQVTPVMRSCPNAEFSISRQNQRWFQRRHSSQARRASMLTTQSTVYSSLALLSTNVHVSPMALSFGPTGTPREGAFNVNGMRSTYNNFLMDGLDNNSYGTSNQNYCSQVVQASPDATGSSRCGRV
jgi:hypothetical protein